MRWLIIFWLGNAFLHYFTDEDAGQATFWMLGALLFVLMEIADNTKVGRGNRP